MSNKNYWFNLKKYGYGWVPKGKLGWSILGVYLVAVLLSGYLLLKDVPENTYTSEVGLFLLLVFVYTLIMVVLSHIKGPKAKWQWGSDDSDDK